MLVYNTTYHADKTRKEEFVNWLRNEYIPQALQRDELSETKLCRVLAEDENDGMSISLQFHVHDLDTLSRWYEACGESLLNEMRRKFGNQVAGFSTLLEVLDI